MAGITSIRIRETAADLEALIQQQPQLKRAVASVVLAAITTSDERQCRCHSGRAAPRQCSTLVEPVYREAGLKGLLETRQSPGRPQVIPEWAVNSLKRRLDGPEAGFGSYTQVQQWLAAFEKRFAMRVVQESHSTANQSRQTHCRFVY